MSDSYSDALLTVNSRGILTDRHCDVFSFPGAVLQLAAGRRVGPHVQGRHVREFADPAEPRQGGRRHLRVPGGHRQAGIYQRTRPQR